ncbi:MAG TPA: heavy metal-associated domain-containing protein [Chthoniobacterales bacterium]
MPNLDPADPHSHLPDDKPVLEEAKLAIEGLEDQGFAVRLEEALRAVAGVESAVADVTRAEIRVTFDARKTHVPALHDALLRTGYHPTSQADNS